MQEDGETGNPVFDFRAGFRKTAGGVQRGLIGAGAILGVLSLVAAIVGRLGGLSRDRAVWGLGVGAVLIVSGVLWGFAWRNRLRAGFRKEYGPKDSP